MTLRPIFSYYFSIRRHGQDLIEGFYSRGKIRRKIHDNSRSRFFCSELNACVLYYAILVLYINDILPGLEIKLYVPDILRIIIKLRRT